MYRQEDDDDFTFPTPQRRCFAAAMRDRQEHVFHLPFPASPSSSSTSPLWLLPSPIRRSFSAADDGGGGRAASPWRARVVLRRGACSPALSDCPGLGGADEEEERMDSLWEDLNDANEDDDGGGGGMELFLGSVDVSRRRSVGGLELTPATKAETEAARAAVLGGASRSARRRRPPLMVVMRALKKLFVAHRSGKLDKLEYSSTTATATSHSWIIGGERD